MMKGLYPDSVFWVAVESTPTLHAFVIKQASHSLIHSFKSFQFSPLSLWKSRQLWWHLLFWHHSLNKTKHYLLLQAWQFSRYSQKIKLKEFLKDNWISINSHILKNLPVKTTSLFLSATIFSPSVFSRHSSQFTATPRSEKNRCYIIAPPKKAPKPKTNKTHQTTNQQQNKIT